MRGARTRTATAAELVFAVSGIFRSTEYYDEGGDATERLRASTWASTSRAGCKRERELETLKLPGWHTALLDFIHGLGDVSSCRSVTLRPVLKRKLRREDGDCDGTSVGFLYVLRHDGSTARVAETDG